tara:strand:- start:2469 stop:3365 length:897 start_codon:yes stop_codon:yes gene_type:complete
MTFLPKSDLLSLEELERVCLNFIKLGVKKIRLTGGEPLVRKGIMKLLENLSINLKTGTLEELTLTTNGSQLAKYAKDLSSCGIKRINVSLDTLDAKKFQDITRWGKLEQVLYGIDTALDAGIKVKINTVALKGINDDEFATLINWCGTKDMDITFIETMPLGEIDKDRVDNYLPLSMIRKQLREEFNLVETDYTTGGPARYMKIEGTKQRIGFITPLTHNFCESCNRVRLTCTGILYMCLGQEDSIDLRKPLRESESDGPLTEAIYQGIARKPKGHDFIIDRRSTNHSIKRHMSTTGG